MDAMSFDKDDDDDDLRLNNWMQLVDGCRIKFRCLSLASTNGRHCDWANDRDNWL